MATAPTLSIVFTPQASHDTTKPPDTQQYVIDWQNLLIALNGVLNTISLAFMPSFPSTASGIVYVASGVPGVLTGTGLVYENASVPGLIAGSGIVFVASGVPSVLGGTGIVYQSSSSPSLMVGSGLVLISAGAPGVLTGTGLVYENASAPGLITGSGLVLVASGVPSVMGGTGVAYEIGSSPGLAALGSSGQILTSTGASTPPTFQTGAFLASVGSSSGIVFVSSGVTATVTGTGSVYMLSSSPAVAAFPSVSAGIPQFLMTNGVSSAPSFNAIFSSAAAGVACQLPAGSGGLALVGLGSSGQVFLSNGGSLYPSFGTAGGTALGLGSSTGTVQSSGGVFTVSTGAVGQVLTGNGPGALPSFQVASGGGIVVQNVYTPGVSRLTNTTYSNSSGKAIFVAVSALLAGPGGPTTFVAVADAGSPPTTAVATVANQGNAVPNMTLELTFWVLNGHNYRVNNTTGSSSITTWTEWS